MTETRAERLARWYDLDLQDDPGDLPLYLALAARTEGAVLELAAGSGRIAIPLALAGSAVVALDNDPAMLARCAAEWRRVRGRRPVDRLRCVTHDLTTARLGERFALVILAVNGLGLLGGREGAAAALRTIAAHLAPGGRAVIDLSLPGPDELAEHDGRLRLEWVRTDPTTGETVMKQTAARYDPATATVTLTQIFDAAPAGGGPLTRDLREDRIALFAAGELVALAEGAGLAVETLAGDLDLGPFGPGAERIILIAGPAARARRGR